MFTRVAKRYDLLNRLLTFGFDKIWRKICAKECAHGLFIVDLCCGTGDLAIQISKRAVPDACVLGIDFNRAMLEKATSKKHAENYRGDKTKNKHDKAITSTHDIGSILADAANLPLKDESINRIGISFSFRNLVYRNLKAKMFLREVLRTLSPQGNFVCLETSQPRNRLLRTLYHLYLIKVVPTFGWLMSGRKGAYRYLGLSAMNFPSAEGITAMLLKAGFRSVSFRHITFGVVALHVCVK